MTDEDAELLRKRREPGGCYCDEVNEFTGRCKSCGATIITIVLPEGTALGPVLDTLRE